MEVRFGVENLRDPGHIVLDGGPDAPRQRKRSGGRNLPILPSEVFRIIRQMAPPARAGIRCGVCQNFRFCISVSASVSNSIFTRPFTPQPPRPHLITDDGLD